MKRIESGNCLPARLMVVVPLLLFVLLYVHSAVGFPRRQAADSPPPTPAPAGSPTPSTPVKDVYLDMSADRIPGDFPGIPFHRFADAVNNNPKAMSVHLHWNQLYAGDYATYTVRYDRKTSTLRYWTYDDNWEGGTPNRWIYIFTKVTDSVIARLAAEDPSAQKGDFMDLIRFGCPWRSISVPVVKRNSAK